MEQVNIEIVDVVNATKIIEAALERGTFKAAEMSGVSAVYDKFAAFVAQQEELAAQAQAQAETEGENE